MKKQEEQALQQEQQALQKKKKHENEIALLTKELALARSMNIEENNFKSDEPLNGAPRWYLYGARILEEELKALKSKTKNNDGIKRAGLNADIKRAQLNGDPRKADLDMELKTWESFKTLKTPNLVVIPSIPPTQPINTAKKAKIIFAAMIAGLVLGVFIAVIRDAIRNLRKRENLFTDLKRDSKFVYER